ncbi:unnamed protein product, partial [marine sediment metagenome]
ISNTGVVSITGGAIENADVNALAAIEWSKMANLTAAHLLVGSSLNVPTDTEITGDVTISDAGVTAIGDGKIENDNVFSAAAIATSKLAGGWTHSEEVLYVDKGQETSAESGNRGDSYKAIQAAIDA